MSNNELFIKATREKMRFPYKGQVTAEDLWDLSITELDKIYKTLNSKKKEVQEDSLLDTKSKEDEELTAQIEIVKYIFTVKKEEKTAAETAKERKEQKQKIMAILANKQDEALHGKSIEELERMLNELG